MTDDFYFYGWVTLWLVVMLAVVGLMVIGIQSNGKNTELVEAFCIEHNLTYNPMDIYPYYIENDTLHTVPITIINGTILYQGDWRDMEN
jgi:hypothetical protein